MNHDPNGTELRHVWDVIPLRNLSQMPLNSVPFNHDPVSLLLDTDVLGLTRHRRLGTTVAAGNGLNQDIRGGGSSHLFPYLLLFLLGSMIGTNLLISFSGEPLNSWIVPDVGIFMP